MTVGIHQIEAVACDNSLFSDGNLAYLIIYILQGLLLGSEFTGGCTYEGIHTPVVEDGGAAVVSAETFLVHTALAIFLTCIDHERILLQQG